MPSQSAPGRGAAGGPARALGVLDITVLMGGPSLERDISLVSGEAISAGLRRRGHQVTQADISPGDTSALDREGIDVVFIALHGSFGESGEVQELCEARELRYTGSGPRASELAMDKAASKQIFKRAGLHTPDWALVEEYHKPADVREMLARLGLPVVVKPVDGGSSVDCTVARDADARDACLEEVLDRYSRALVEQYVEGRELTVSILADEALPVLEIIPAGEFYDYRAKYDDDVGTRYVFDHGLSDETVGRVQSDALTAHRSLGCRDVSRVDFMMDTAGRLDVLEVNTIPGFTVHSLLPMAAAKVGVSFDELVERLVEMALNNRIE